jgi:hypothetical protein
MMKKPNSGKTIDAEKDYKVSVIISSKHRSDGKSSTGGDPLVEIVKANSEEDARKIVMVEYRKKGINEIMIVEICPLK